MRLLTLLGLAVVFGPLLALLAASPFVELNPTRRATAAAAPTSTATAEPVPTPTVPPPLPTAVTVPPTRPPSAVLVLTETKPPAPTRTIPPTSITVVHQPKASSPAPQPPTPVPSAPTPSTPPVTPPAKPTAAVPSRIGQRVEVSGIGLTVVSVKKVQELQAWQVAEPGQTFLVLDVLIENKSPRQVRYAQFFKLRDSEGYEYGAGGSPEQPLLSGQLNTGEQVRGNVAFKVRSGATGLVMTYTVSGLFEGSPPQFAL